MMWPAGFRGLRDFAEVTLPSKQCLHCLVSMDEAKLGTVGISAVHINEACLRLPSVLFMFLDHRPSVFESGHEVAIALTFLIQ